MIYHDLPFNSMGVFHGYVSLPEGMVVSKVIGVPPVIIHFILGIFHEISHPYIVWGYPHVRKLLYNGDIMSTYAYESKYKAPIHTLNPQADPYPSSIPKSR